MTATPGIPELKGILSGTDAVYHADRKVGKKKPENIKKINVFGGNSNGVPGGTRTPNPLVRSQVLYPIELRVRSV